MVGFCSSPRYVEHQTGPHHPERPDRIRAVHRAVRQAGMITSPDPFPDFEIDLALQPQSHVQLVELSPDAADEKWLSLVHTPAMIEKVKHVCALGGGVLDQGDTPIGAASYEIAMLALGGLLKSCDAVMSG